MGQPVINKTIAGAILFGRAAGIKQLRKIAEASLGPVSDALWQRVEPEWQWHYTQSDQILQAATLSTPRTPD